MSDYLSDPLDVLLFDKDFRVQRNLLNSILTRFEQTPTNWRATYQDEDQSMTFTGTVKAAREWLKRGEKKT